MHDAQEKVYSLLEGGFVLETTSFIGILYMLFIKDTLVVNNNNAFQFC